MTNEAIKALMIFALYGILELALYYSSIGKPAKQQVRFRSTAGRAANRDLADRGPED